MKGSLLAASRGTRLRPLTDSIPKRLVPIRGHPLLSIWLEFLSRHAISELLVNVHSHVERMSEHLARHANRLSIKLFGEPELLGSAGTIRANRDWVGSEPSFWVFYADILTNANLHKMLEFHNSRRAAATLGLHEVLDPVGCGVAVLDNAGVIQEFQEKPANILSSMVFAGILIGTPGLLDAISPTRPADLGYDVLPHLVGRMCAYPIREYVFDVGTPANYEKAQVSWPDF